MSRKKHKHKNGGNFSSCRRKESATLCFPPNIYPQLFVFLPIFTTTLCFPLIFTSNTLFSPNIYRISLFSPQYLTQLFVFLQFYPAFLYLKLNLFPQHHLVERANKKSIQQFPMEYGHTLTKQKSRQAAIESR